MTALSLTPETIQVDIDAYQARIQSARDRLAALPTSAATWKERKKLKSQRRVLSDEIEHVKRLVGYAEDALAEIK